MREGLCGDPGARGDEQHEHEEIIPLPAGLEEGVIEQTSAVAFSSANAEFLNERSLYRLVCSLAGLPTPISRSFQGAGSRGALDASTVVQQEHEEICLLPACLEEGSIAQTCAV